jgi:class 3 adenylate cyclase
VLPFPPDEFRRSSVDIAAGDWAARFDRLLAAAASVTVTSDHPATGSVATFEYANLVLTGSGQLRAQLLDTTLCGLAVWDRAGGGARGGSASVVSLWEARGIPVSHVNLGYLRQEIHSRAVPGPAAGEPGSGGDAAVATHHRIKALLFADAVGYSLLTEDQIPRYVSGFLGAVADLNQRTRHRFEHVETAGDGLYMVFDDALDAAHYALELSALATGTDWTAHGLPASFNLRIALHCGPVYCGRDPVTQGALFTGPHTSRAARIEPITPPGQVYASSAFAAVTAARGSDGIAMRYVGRTPLAKRSGSLALYHLQPAH